MKQANLLLSNAANDDLAVLAERICGLLGATGLEERDSENHPGGGYFKARTSFAEIKVMVYEDSGHPDLPVWLCLRPSSTKDFDANFIDELVRSRLLPAGFKVALVQNFGALTEKRKDY